MCHKPPFKRKKGGFRVCLGTLYPLVGCIEIPTFDRPNDRPIPLFRFGSPCDLTVQMTVQMTVQTLKSAIGAASDRAV